ncbi:hypothetical protein [Zhongshania borealis]|uniref:DNA polymerase III subunit chi n=1 Tax=Zhongshania borealis TaxID=889488 RepID=A0ABP7W7M7_9GAMM
MEKNKPLLGELEALQAVLLDTNGIDPASIPLLEDIIEPAPRSDYASLENDELRFSDAGIAFQGAPQPPATAEAYRQPTRADDGDYARELLIQDVIDSMMPNIEAELRKRLLSLDASLLERWYEQAHRND